MKKCLSLRSILTIFTLYFIFVESGNAQVYTWRKKFASVGGTVAINPLNPNSVYAEGAAGTFNVSYDRGSTWIARSSPGLSFIRQILVHPSDTMTIFCAANSGPGLRKSTDDGLTWKTVIVGYNIDGESVTYDPVHPDTMYAGRFDDGTVYRSTDRGENWTNIGSTGSVLCALDVRHDSSNIIFAGSGGGTISKSTDFGATWKIVRASEASGFQEVPRIMSSPVNPMIAYAAIYGAAASALGIWKTTDGGEQWFQTALQGIPVWGMVIDPYDDNIVYTGSFTSTINEMYKTTDGGISWQFESLGFPSRGFTWSLKLHPLDPTILWAAFTNGTFGFGGVYRWTSSTTTVSGQILDAVTNDPVTSGYISIPATGDSVNLSQTGGKFHFGYYEGDPSLAPTAHVTVYPYYPKDEQLFFVPDSGTVQNITVSKLKTSFIHGIVKDSLTGDPVRTEVQLHASTSIGNLVVSESTDVGGNFSFDSISVSYQGVVSYPSLQVMAAEIPYATVTVGPLTLDTLGLELSIDPRADVFLVGEDSANYSGYYLTALQSLGVKAYAWNLKTQGPAPLGNVGVFKKNTVIYFTGSKHTPLAPSEVESLKTSLDNGSNLFLSGQDIAELNDTTSLLTDYLHIGYGGTPSIYYMRGYSASELFSTTAFWISVGGGAQNQTSADILVATDAQTRPVLGYNSTASGGLSGVRRNNVAGHGGKAVVFGFGFEAIYQAAIQKTVMQKILGYFDGSISVGVDEQNSETMIPSAFRLEQNYPNPFNPLTIFNFQLPIGNDVTLKVYNILGEEVVTLVSEFKQPGSYEVQWDASNMPSGVYYYRLTTSATTETKKMVLLK